RDMPVLRSPSSSTTTRLTPVRKSTSRACRRAVRQFATSPLSFTPGGGLQFHRPRWPGAEIFARWGRPLLSSGGPHHLGGLAGIAACVGTDMVFGESERAVRLAEC